MAIKTQKVVQDTASELVLELMRQHNNLLDTIYAAATFAALLTALDTDVVRKVNTTLPLTAAPKRTAV